MRTLRKTTETKKGGYAILELLFYLTLFAVLISVVINAMVTMTKSFKETAIQSELVQSGSVMERMVREIRAAYNVDPTSTATDLKLDTNSGANTKIEFKLLGSNLQLLENEVLTGNLNAPNISVTNLAFTQITTIKGVAVKLSLTLQVNNVVPVRTENFYDTIVLRGDY